jgi:hypothetical protein
MFEDFVSLCTISCIVVQRSSYLLVISLEVVDRGSNQHDNRLEFQLGCLSTRIFNENFCFYLYIPQGGDT